MTIIVILFWNFKDFQYSFDSSRVKQLIYGKTNFIYQLPLELRGDLNKEIFGKYDNWGGEKYPHGQSPFQEKKHWHLLSNIMEKMMQKFSVLAQFTLLLY